MNSDSSSGPTDAYWSIEHCGWVPSPARVIVLPEQRDPSVEAAPAVAPTAGAQFIVSADGLVVAPSGHDLHP